MMFNQSADELIKTPYGSRLYNQILSRRQEESSLDRVVARVFGDPIETDEDKTGKEPVAESNVTE
jgi:tRNA(Glu) U13 pseudouridine synthase TruD